MLVPVRLGENYRRPFNLRDSLNPGRFSRCSRAAEGIAGAASRPFRSIVCGIKTLVVVHSQSACGSQPGWAVSMVLEPDWSGV